LLVRSFRRTTSCDLQGFAACISAGRAFAQGNLPAILGNALHIRAAPKRTLGKTMNPEIQRAPTTEHAAPLSFAQQRLWLLDRLIPLGSVYNIQHALRLSGELDEAALRSALNEVARRHEVLRTRFGMQDGEPVQVNRAGAPDRADERRSRPSRAP
jgi:hypothetical protein